MSAELNTDLPDFSSSLHVDSVQERFGIAIGDVSRLWRDRLNSRLKPLGLSPVRWHALLYLSRIPKGMTQGELARLLTIEAPTAARLVKHLEDAGWITRQGTPEDGRCKVVHLTAKAKDVVIQIDQEVNKLRAETLGRINTEQASAGLAALQAFKGLLRAV